MHGPVDEKADVAVAVRDPVPVAGGVGAAALQASTWDPYEVWLTRVKQPRDRAVATQRASPVRRGDSVS